MHLSGSLSVSSSAGKKFGEGLTRTMAVVRFDGLVSMNIPSIIRSSCKIRVIYYPFDSQKCILKFGSWTFDGGALALHIEVSDSYIHNTAQHSIAQYSTI